MAMVQHLENKSYVLETLSQLTSTGIVLVYISGAANEKIVMELKWSVKG